MAAIFPMTFWQPSGGGGPVGNSATWLSDDTTTQGDWIGTYGGDGFVIAQYDTPNFASGSINGGYESTADLPSYASFWQYGSLYCWSTNDPTNPRMLTRPDYSEPIASVWYGGAWNIVINVTQPCVISIYLMSYDTNGRDTGITVYDNDSSAELVAERRYSGSTIGDGVWARYAVSGNLLLTMNNYLGPNAIINAIMFD